ncbi:MAG: hypothetical protein K2Q10_06010, partial [Rhodospirillales bacterium]|nr:hypothetical protein [Rhodospirillales bacterium]
MGVGLFKACWSDHFLAFPLRPSHPFHRDASRAGTFAMTTPPYRVGLFVTCLVDLFRPEVG